MTKREVMDALEGRGPIQELQWMVDLGANRTVSVSGYYPLEKQPGSISHLMGFNELQHQVYGASAIFAAIRSGPSTASWTGCYTRRNSMESPGTSVAISSLK